ncbi:TPA: hypothetical protein ACX3IN_000348 [Vibrio parahaemolyticus]
MKSKDLPIINEQFWDALFFNGTMPWDRNQTPNELKHYLKRIADKAHSVFIPGCGDMTLSQWITAQKPSVLRNLSLVNIKIK